MLAATGATMANPGAMTEEKSEISAKHSPFGISNMVTQGRIQEGKLAFLLEIIPSCSINMTLERADMLLKLTINKVLEHTKTSFINLRIEAVEETIQMLRDTFERFHNSSYSSRTKRAWLDLVGNFLKTVFGVATEKDVKLMKLENKKETDNIKIVLNKISIDNQIIKDSKD